MAGIPLSKEREWCGPPACTCTSLLPTNWEHNTTPISWDHQWTQSKVMLPMRTQSWAPEWSAWPSSHMGTDCARLVQGREYAVPVPERWCCQLKLIARQKAKDATRSNNIGWTGVVMRGGRGATFTSTGAKGFPGEHVVIDFYSWIGVVSKWQWIESCNILAAPWTKTTTRCIT